MKISDCQARIVSLLTADPFFTDPDPTKVVGIISKRRGDLEAAMNEKLNAIGVGLVVLLQGVALPENDLPSLMVQVRFALFASENPNVNTTGKTAEDIAEKAMSLLHYQFNQVSAGDETPGSRFIVDKKAVTPVPPPPTQPFLNIQTVTINTELTIN
jgi:hypothetical protein